MTRITQALLFRWVQPHHTILIMVISVTLSIISGYIISAGAINIIKTFPYITFKITEPPASSVFGILLNIGVFAGFACVYFRHRFFECRHNETITDEKTDWRLSFANNISMVIGLSSCFGIVVLASLQLTKASLSHSVFAFLVFILTNAYCWLQSFLSIATISDVSSKRQAFLRVIISSIATFSILLTTVLGNIASNQISGNKLGEKCHWKESDPGYSEHLGSSFFQWIVTIALLLFFLTFYHDFRTLECHVEMEIEPRPIIDRDGVGERLDIRDMETLQSDAYEY